MLGLVLHEFFIAPVPFGTVAHLPNKTYFIQQSFAVVRQLCLLSLLFELLLTALVRDLVKPTTTTTKRVSL